MINLDALDSFAVDHLQFELRCSRSSTASNLSTPPTDEQLFCAIETIRALVMDGFIDDAWSLCQQLFAVSLPDPRPQLRVRLHKLFELIHTAESIPKHKSVIYSKAIRDALRYSQDLAAFSLDAFPEAYGIFTESMMLFAFPEQTSGKGIVQQKRKALAGDLVSTAKMVCSARESRLSFLVRYLLLIFVQFQPTLGHASEAEEENSSSLQTLISSLLNNDTESEQDTSNITWQTDGPRPTTFNNTTSFQEADVQALPERVNISRQDAIESIRFAGGDLDLALKNELGRVIVNRHQFRMMVVEYCAARGLDVFETSQSLVQSSTHNTFAPLSSDQQRVLVSNSSLSQSSLYMFSTMRKLRSLAESGNFDSFEETLRSADPAVLETYPALTFKVGQCRMMNHISRGDHAAALQIAQTTLGPLAKAYPEFVPLLEGITSILVYSSDLSFSNGNPCLVPQGEKASGLGNVENSEMDVKLSGQSCCSKEQMDGELISQASGCQKPDETIRFNKFLSDVIVATSDCASAEAITLEAYKALESKYGEPELVKLFSRLVSAHEEWQKQTLMTDRFASMLGINRLKGLESAEKDSGGGGKLREVGADMLAQSGERSRTSREGGRHGEVDRRRETRREDMILQIMEFLAMSRAEALSVVNEHPNAENAHTILDSLL